MLQLILLAKCCRYYIPLRKPCKYMYVVYITVQVDGMLNVVVSYSLMERK